MTAPKEQSKVTKNNFWSTCPLKSGYFPSAPCALGKYSAETKDVEKGCPWYINSSEDNYCFWKWVRRVSNEDGFMEPLLQHEITTLLNYSGTKVHSAYREALEKLRQFPEFEDLEEVFKSK